MNARHAIHSALARTTYKTLYALLDTDLEKKNTRTLPDV
jgi:hypothetical protein